MKNYLLKALAGLLLTMVSGAALAASVWEISKGDNTLILGGTVHLLKPSDFPLPPAYDHAFDRADKVFFEADIGAASSMEFAGRLMRSMMLTDGSTLRQKLQPETWQALQEFAAQRQLPLGMLTLFRPAYAAITLTVLEMQRLGMSDGVDQYYYRAAKRQNKPMGFLEDLDEVLEFLVFLDKLDGDKVVLSTLQELENVGAQMDATVAAWRAGDMGKLYALMGEDMRQKFPEMYRALLTSRNQSWFEQMQVMLENPELELVLVGALHMAGPSSLLKMFTDAGYKVKPYRVE